MLSVSILYSIKFVYVATIYAYTHSQAELCVNYYLQTWPFIYIRDVLITVGALLRCTILILNQY